MHIHILGICGTFMGSLAVLAKQLGHEVSGCDANVYPPMSTQLEQQGIELLEGYDPAHLQPAPDLVVIGNAMSRGNPCVEYVLNQQLNYTSGPQWLCDEVLNNRWVLAVAGTHGKTTTTSMLTWVLEQAGMQPGYLIGGVPMDFSASARLGERPFFVIEADEYDSAFFDKRSKFVHYRPRTVILNNLEFDHADIFNDISDIQRQFHHLVRTVPEQGRIVLSAEDKYLQQVIKQGCWSECVELSLTDNNASWYVKALNSDGSEFEVWHKQQLQGVVNWQHSGEHNMANALATLAAAHHVGVRPEHGIEALNSFAGVKRRMEKLLSHNNIDVYDDFAHHPTAIKTTLQGLRRRVGNERIIAVIEPRSNTMRMGVHADNLARSTEDADEVVWYEPADVDWNLDHVVSASKNTATLSSSTDVIVENLCSNIAATSGAALHIVIMSNGGFDNIHRKLVEALQHG